MGVGKTLTAISVMWAFARKGACKSLIVCPSSLVDNWAKEMKHWLGTKLKPLVMRSGCDAAALINTFTISMITLYPVLVLSYEVRGGEGGNACFEYKLRMKNNVFNNALKFIPLT